MADIDPPETRDEFMSARVRWAMTPDRLNLPDGFAAMIAADLKAEYDAQMDAAMREMFGDLENFRPTGLAQIAPPVPPAFGRSATLSPRAEHAWRLAARTGQHRSGGTT